MLIESVVYRCRYETEIKFLFIRNISFLALTITLALLLTLGLLPNVHYKYRKLKIKFTVEKRLI